MNFFKYLIAVLGGFQFGYTIGIMAGALLFLASYFNLTPLSKDFVVSSVLIGAFIGAIVGGELVEKQGRKRAQQFVAIFFFIGTLAIVVSSSLVEVIVGRLIQGLAMGAISVIGPLYIAEISSPEKRGRYISFYQLAVTFGVLCAYLVSYLFSESGAWRWMFALALIPALFHGLGFFFLPNSFTTDFKQKASWKALLEPKYRSSFALAVLLNILQQLIGINAVIYFAPSIFELCGVKSASSAIFSAVLIGIINFISTILSVFFIDTKGRRPLLLLGAAGMAVSMSVLSIACLNMSSLATWALTASLMLYVGCFAFSFGPICQLIAAEILPKAIRSRGLSVAMLSNILFNFIVVFTFIDLTTYLSTAGAFLTYGCFCVIAFCYVWKKIPETKGTTLQ